ncbi:cell wall hydrolase [Salsuginibacillus kocurii]|uniref:cell wall hydrolase n=1 Tax=Salsuginibacillus kocurii TaxID=427078 RepID=UPI00035D7197|nr:cell wall hydrolase [Salsuginibacillus kocurii]
MKKSLLVSSFALALAFVFSVDAEAGNTYTVEEGESLWDVAVDQGVTVDELLETNNLEYGEVQGGETLSVPASISQEEHDLFSSLVYAEAKGEPYAGKVAVATVVLNRVDSDDFPNDITSVINEVEGGTYAFSPVMDGAINQQPDQESRDAVNEALAFRGQGQGSVYFYNPETADNHWIATQEETIRIGNHVFAR